MIKFSLLWVCRYKTKKDMKEYLYSDLEPFDCHRIFPCFDQPNLKGYFELSLITPEEWVTLSNSQEEENQMEILSEAFNFEEKLKIENEYESILIGQHEIKNKKYKFHKFKKTPKIPLYVFGICAGAYYNLKCPFPSDIPLNLYLRENVKPEENIDEIFRIIIEGIKWFSEYFGFNFPFDKMDLVCCPDFKGKFIKK